MVEPCDSRGLIALRDTRVGSGHRAAPSNDLDVDGEVADGVAADVAERRRAQLRGRVRAFVAQHGRGGIHGDRGDDAAVNSLEGRPLLIDVRPEATITESRDACGVDPVHVMRAR